MARRMKVKWDIKAFEEIRRMPGVEDEVAGRVNTVRSAVEARGWGNYEGGTEDGGDRVRGYVVTTDFAAMQDEASSHPLEAALAALSTGGGKR